MKKRRKLVSLLFLWFVLCVAEPVFCQSSSAVSEQKQSPVVQQMTDDFKNYTPSYIGVATARDAFGTDNAWEWYWDKEGAYQRDARVFWDDDAISQFFQGVADKCFVPAWNGDGAAVCAGTGAGYDNGCGYRNGGARN